MKQQKILHKITGFFLTAMLFYSLFAVPVFAQSGQNNRSYSVFRGVVLDSTDRHPLVFASVFVEGTNIGTVTNSDGKFLIKIPGKYKNNRLGISMMGYKTRYLSPEHPVFVKNKILLKPASINIKEVVIRDMDPLHLLKAARDKVPENFSCSPMMMTGFYREWIKKNNSYVSLGEAILDIYKASYDNPVDFDRVKMYKGRKGKTAKRMDTLLVKFQGGPLIITQLDIAKNPGDLLSEEMIYYYDFSPAGIVSVDGRETYKINFSEKEYVEIPLYEGTIYLDMKTLAFVGAEIRIPRDRLDAFAKYMIKKKPPSLKAKLLGANYLIQYRKVGDKWYLNYVRSETKYRFKWKKRLFSSVYTIVSETAVTDADTTKIKKPRYRERLKVNDIFSEKVGNFEDTDFWGADNIIEPDQSIQKAIKKIKRKLKKKQHALELQE